MTAQNGKFELVDFTLQAGATLPGADIAYRTSGVLNTDKSNTMFDVDFPMRGLANVKRTGTSFATHGMQSMSPVAVGEAAVDFFTRHPISGLSAHRRSVEQTLSRQNGTGAK